MRKTGLFVLVVFVAGVVVPALFSRNRNAKATSSSAESATTPNSIALSQTTWTPIGPQPTVPLPGDPHMGYPTVSGRVTSLAFDPRDTTDKTIYAGSPDGGLWVTTDGGQSWTALTDSGPSLAVRSIALDPTTNPTTIYVGTSEQELLNDDSLAGAGVLKSTDGGKTWTQDQTFSQIIANNPSDAWPEIVSLAVAPDNNQVLLAAIGSSDSASLPGGIWRSTDGGQTWTAVLTNAVAGTSVIFDPAVPGQAFAAVSGSQTSTENGIYESTDDGATWTLVETNANFGVARLSLTPPTATASGVLVAAVADSSTDSANLLGVFSAPIATGGTLGTFSQLTNAPDFCGDTVDSSSNGECSDFMAVGASPVNPKLIYAGGTNEYGGDTLTVSSDGGSTWSADLYAGNGACTSKTSSGACINANGQLETGTQAIAFSSDAKVLAVGGNGGVWSTGNVGASVNVTWDDLNPSLGLARVYPGISIFPDNPDMGLAGTAANGAEEYGGNLQWQKKLCASGGFSVVTPDGSTAYVACADNGGVYSLDSSGKATWVSNGIGSCTGSAATDCYDANSIAPLAIDALNPSILYFGAMQPGNNGVVYQTTDGGQSWLPISPAISDGASTEVTAIAVSPTNPNVVYAGSAMGDVYETNDALDGANSKWQSATGLGANSYDVVNDIAVNPSLPNIAYLAFAGNGVPGASPAGHVYETGDSGQTWTNISGNLPNVSVNALVVDPSISTIYAATDVGVYATTDNGATWAPLATGLPKAAVLGLTLDPQTRVLWAGTYGRGMWALQLAPAPLPPTLISSPLSIDFGNQDVGTTTAAKTVTITNTGGATLTITQIAVPPPFAETNNCGSSLAVGSNCTIQVTFAPTSASTISTWVYIDGNFLNGAEEIPVSGAGQDFALSAGSGTASLSQGGSATDTISVKPLGANGFTDPLSLSCSGLPQEATCAFSPATVTPDSKTVSSTLTIATTAPSSAVPLFGPGGPGGPEGWLLALWVALLLALSLLAAVARKAGRKAGFAVATCALLVCLVAPVVSCGGGGNVVHDPGTPTGTYSVTVNAKSGSLEHSTTVALTVSAATK